MRTLKTMFTLLLAIVWLPLTSHCLLMESASAFASLACCTHETTPSEHKNDCDTGSCDVEDAQYRCLEDRVAVPAVDRLVAFELPPLLVTTLKSESIATHQSSDALLQLPVAWQFSFRTAAPPRAPSLVS